MRWNERTRSDAPALTSSDESNWESAPLRSFSIVHQRQAAGRSRTCWQASGVGARQPRGSSSLATKSRRPSRSVSSQSASDACSRPSSTAVAVPRARSAHRRPGEGWDEGPRSFTVLVRRPARGAPRVVRGERGNGGGRAGLGRDREAGRAVRPGDAERRVSLPADGGVLEPYGGVRGRDRDRRAAARAGGDPGRAADQQQQHARDAPTPAAHTRSVRSDHEQNAPSFP